MWPLYLEISEGSLCINSKEIPVQQCGGAISPWAEWKKKYKEECSRLLDIFIKWASLSFFLLLQILEGWIASRIYLTFVLNACLYTVSFSSCQRHLRKSRQGLKCYRGSLALDFLSKKESGALPAPFFLHDRLTLQITQKKLDRRKKIPRIMQSSSANWVFFLAFFVLFWTECNFKLFFFFFFPPTLHCSSPPPHLGDIWMLDAFRIRGSPLSKKAEYRGVPLLTAWQERSPQLPCRRTWWAFLCVLPKGATCSSPFLGQRCVAPGWGRRTF